MISLWIPAIYSCSLQWRHNGQDGVSNHQPHDCLLNRLFWRRSKKTSKLRVTGLCAGNSPGTGEFPAQMAINTENVSIWWRHHFIPIHWDSLTGIHKTRDNRSSASEVTLKAKGCTWQSANRGHALLGLYCTSYACAYGVLKGHHLLGIFRYRKIITDIGNWLLISMSPISYIR